MKALVDLHSVLCNLQTQHPTVFTETDMAEAKTGALEFFSKGAVKYKLVTLKDCPPDKKTTREEAEVSLKRYNSLKPIARWLDEVTA